MITHGSLLISGFILLAAWAHESSLPRTAEYVRHEVVLAPVTGTLMEGLSTSASEEGRFRREISLYATSSRGGVFFTLADAAPSPANGFAPGMVVLSIKKMGVKKWFATNTAALPTPAGAACIVDAGPEAPSSLQNIELTSYTVIDGNHLRLSLRKPHISGATVFVGEGCQFEPVDTF